MQRRNFLGFLMAGASTRALGALPKSYGIAAGWPLGPGQAGATAITLGTLSVSPTTATAGSPYAGTIVGTTPGSTLILLNNVGGKYSLSQLGDTWTLNGTGLTAGTDAPQVQETLAGATGSPKTSPAFSIVVGALAAAVPYVDNFTGAAATLTGRALVTGSPTVNWASRQGGTGNTQPIALDGAGHLNGNQNTGTGNTNSTYVEVDIGISPRKWYRLELNANPSSTPSFNTISNSSGAFNINATYNSGNLWSRMGYWSSNAGLVDFGFTNNADSRTGALSQTLHTNTDSAGKGVTPTVGDVWDLRVYTSGGSKFVEPYYNGQQIASAINISAFGTPINDRFSFRGDSPSGTFDRFMIGDPDAHGMISVYAPRIAQVPNDASGSTAFTLKLVGDYTGPAPPSLTISVIDPTTDAAFAGYSNIPLSSFATGAANTPSSDGSWSGRIVVANGIVSLTNGCYVIVTRNDLVGGASSSARSGLIYPGHIVAIYGQSLAVKSWSNVQSGLTYTVPSRSFMIDGSADNDGAGSSFPVTSINRKTRHSNNTTVGEANYATSVVQARVAAAQGADTGLAYIRGGFGGTYYIQRQPTGLDPTGTGIFTALLDGIRLAGNDFGWVLDCGGEYEAVGAPSSAGSGYVLSTFTGPVTTAGTDQANLVGYIQAIYDAIDAVVAPRTVKVLMRPVGAIWSGTDVRVEAMRRMQWYLTQAYPSRYILGGYINELQHVSGDQYHLIGNGFVEQNRRLEMARLKNMGVIATDRTGPKLFSVTAHSDTSITVRFDKNGASALEVVNTVATLTDYRGGLRFSTNSTFTGQKTPTAVSAPTDIDSTYAEITWTFASGSFGTNPVYVSGPYGLNPFNPTNNATVAAAMATNASMVRGVFTGEDYNIPVQPYFSGTPAAPQDYLIGS